MDDHPLVAALVAGDPRGLEGAYRAYADRLYTYCRGMLRDPDAAADAVHDTFVLASQRADQLRDPDRLRSWLYAIARNECLRALRGRVRQVALEDAGEVSAPEVDPVAGLRAAEIQELVWAAAAGLNSGDREVFELAVRHNLEAPDVGSVLGISVAHAHARLSRARTQLGRALGALLVARTGAQECPQLAELLAGWDGGLTVLLRKRVARHIESCDTCAERERQQLRPAALFSAYAALPFLVVPAELWPRLELTGHEPELVAEIVRQAGQFDRGGGFPRPYDVRRRRLAMAGVGAVAVAALLAAGAGATVLPITPAAEPDPLPTQAALAPTSAPSTALPTASTTPTPMPGATPSTTPGPTQLPAPPPPPPLAPPPPAAPPPPPAPFSVTAEGEIRCETPGYVLVVTASANRPLEQATLVAELGPERRTYPMRVDPGNPRVAFGQTEQVADRRVEWWVVVTSLDGERGQSETYVTIPECDG